MAFPSHVLEQTQTYTPRGYIWRIGGAHCNCPQSRTFPLGRKGAGRILLYGIVVMLSTNRGSPQGRLAGLGIGPDCPLLGSRGKAPKERKPDAQIIALSPGTPPSSTAAHPTQDQCLGVANFNPDLLDTIV